MRDKSFLWMLSYWFKKTEKVLLEISHKIHKENTCVKVFF